MDNLEQKLINSQTQNGVMGQISNKLKKAVLPILASGIIFSGGGVGCAPDGGNPTPAPSTNQQQQVFQGREALNYLASQFGTEFIEKDFTYVINDASSTTINANGTIRVGQSDINPTIAILYNNPPTSDIQNIMKYNFSDMNVISDTTFDNPTADTKKIGYITTIDLNRAHLKQELDNLTSILQSVFRDKAVLSYNLDLNVDGDGSNVSTAGYLENAFPSITQTHLYNFNPQNKDTPTTDNLIVRDTTGDQVGTIPIIRNGSILSLPQTYQKDNTNYQL